MYVVNIVIKFQLALSHTPVSVMHMDKMATSVQLCFMRKLLLAIVLMMLMMMKQQSNKSSR